MFRFSEEKLALIITISLEEKTLRKEASFIHLFELPRPAATYTVSGIFRISRPTT